MIFFTLIIFQSILTLSKGHCKSTTAGGIVNHYCGTLAKARSNSTLRIHINYYIKSINKHFVKLIFKLSLAELPNTRVTHTVSMVAVSLKFHENGTLIKHRKNMRQWAKS